VELLNAAHDTEPEKNKKTSAQKMSGCFRAVYLFDRINRVQDLNIGLSFCQQSK
jgi:hypothetical protein